jgi:TRAP-type mannitol/chloroaromatic compound transport system permease small subunit
LRPAAHGAAAAPAGVTSMPLALRLVAIADFCDRLIDKIGRVTGWTSFALVCVMAFNVLLRYLFRTGSVAMQELEWHLMAPICLLGLSYAIRHDGHVQVDIFFGRFPESVRRVITLVSMLCVVAVVAILLKLSIPYVMQSYSIGEISPDPGGLTHRWILKSMLPLGFTLLLVQSVGSALRALAPILDPAVAGEKAAEPV